MPTPMLDIDMPRLLRLFRSNLSTHKIADLLGLPTITVQRRLADVNEPRPPMAKTRLARIRRAQAEREWYEACRRPKAA
jgi:hypothetical protein